MSYQVKHGFLGQEYTNQYKFISKKYRQLFDLSNEINDICHDIFNGLEGKVNNNDVKEIVISTLFAKAMSSFQAIVILSKKGMNKEANCILRTFLEISFWIIAIARNENFFQKYILYGERRKILSYKELLNYHPNWHDLFGGREELEKVIGQYEYEKTREQVGLSKSEIEILDKPYKIAECAGISDDYMVVYSILSNDIHSNAGSLDEYYSIDDYQNIKSITYGPKDSDIYRVFFSSIDLLIIIVESMLNVFNFDVSYNERIQIIKDRFLKSKKTYIESRTSKP